MYFSIILYDIVWQNLVNFLSKIHLKRKYRQPITKDLEIKHALTKRER